MGAAFPRMVGMGEEEGKMQLAGDLLMACELLSVI